MCAGQADQPAASVSVGRRRSQDLAVISSSPPLALFLQLCPFPSPYTRSPSLPHLSLSLSPIISLTHCQLQTALSLSLLQNLSPSSSEPRAPFHPLYLTNSASTPLHPHRPLHHPCLPPPSSHRPGRRLCNSSISTPPRLSNTASMDSNRPRLQGKPVSVCSVAPATRSTALSVNGLSADSHYLV